MAIKQPAGIAYGRHPFDEILMLWPFRSSRIKSAKIEREINIRCI